MPIHIQSTGAFAGAAGGRMVSGIIGTGVLSQFRASLDFGGGELVLEPRGTSRSEGTAIPFWLLGDHFVTVSARPLSGELNLAS